MYTTRFLIIMAIVVIVGVTAGNYLIQFFGKKDWGKAFERSFFETMASAHM